MSTPELPKTYDPVETEAKWLEFWERHDFFKADPTSSKPPYCIVIPPPNVTGVLHMGHALVNTLQDILIRWKRMSGFEALWVPGTDHAGIATQTVVERHLMATSGKRRVDFPREEFLKIVWEWKEKHEKTILSQLKRLGSSCDWSRLRFTMDEGCNHAVRAIFHKLFREGLIYRGDYLVNWDPVAQTALADDEVEYEEKEGFLWYFKFPLKNSSEQCLIATTRPETMLGDVAVAVSNKDERYAHLVGKTIVHPLTDREIPIIADSFVDPSFGSGMVKITPAHDQNDYQIASHHNLPLINILTPEARINENGGPFQGMSVEEARRSVVEKMKENGLVEKIVPHRHRVGHSYRSKAVIEPYLSKQWFVKMAPFVDALQAVVKEGRVKIIPKLWEHTYFHWIDNLRDWCISRQLWWGHRIPIWYHRDDPAKMICYEGEGVPPEVLAEPEMWIQDPDVLDTWFSSMLWPFSTLGWPEKTPELAKFYPNAVLVTGHDILFFWVARMILIGEYAMDDVPFKETFLHGLIYGKSYWRKAPGGGIQYVSGEEKNEYDMGKPLPSDVESKWEKLSKSKGNVIDPIEMIKTYGADAVRLSLCSCANQTPQIDLDRRRFEEFKNFANKVWNGARFVFMHLEDLDEKSLNQGLDPSLFSLEDRWILSQLNRVNRDVNAALASYSFDNAALFAYDFFWKQFCAYYLEIIKPVLYGKEGTAAQRVNKQKLLVILLSNAIRLLHPMTPFITEELFHRLKSRFPAMETKKGLDPYTEELIVAFAAASCAVAPYPKLICESDLNEKIDEAFALMEKVVYTIRNIRGEMKIPPATATEVYIYPTNEMLRENVKMITALVRTQKVELLEKAPELRTLSATGVIGDLTILIPLPEELAKAERARLEKERERLIKSVEGVKRLLENPDFHQKASPEVIQKQKEALATGERELAKIELKLR